MGQSNCRFEKYKSEHTRMEYLNSRQKKCKYGHKKNKILKVKNSLLRIEKKN